MKIYLPENLRKPNHSIMAQPGNEFPVSDWLDENGKARMFTVVFKYGCAEVADNLGNYMIDRGLAKSSPILLFEGVA